MPTRIAHHRAPPPPPRHTTSTHATPHTTPPAALVDRRHEATTAPHLDGFDHTPRQPYGVRLSGDQLSLDHPQTTDLHARDRASAPAHTPTPHADATPSIAERAEREFPLQIPELLTSPTGAASTIGTHDGDSDARAEASRADSRLDGQQRSQPNTPPPTQADRSREDALHTTTEAIERGAFCASPAGVTSPDCP